MLQLPSDPIRDNSMVCHLQMAVFVDLIVVMLVKWVRMPNLDHDHHDRGLDHDLTMIVCMDFPFDDQLKLDVDHFDDQTIDFLLIKQIMTDCYDNVFTTGMDIIISSGVPFSGKLTRDKS